MTQAIPGHKARKVTPEMPARKGRKVLKVIRAMPGRRAHREFRARRAARERTSVSWATTQIRRRCLPRFRPRRQATPTAWGQQSHTTSISGMGLMPRGSTTALYRAQREKPDHRAHKGHKVLKATREMPAHRVLKATQATRVRKA